MEQLAVTVPTRDRPAHLRRCLEALEVAREPAAYTVYVCDSSTTQRMRAEVAAVCAAFPFVELSHHEGQTRGAARNVCTRVARSKLIVTVDDDVCVEPDAIRRLLEAYGEGSGPRVVAGSLDIGGTWTIPGVFRYIGYGRPLRRGESPSFVLTGLLLYPRVLALAWPWNDRVPAQEDLFMCAVWRMHGIQLLDAPGARGVHEGVPARTLAHQESHIYVRLFDAVFANRDPVRAITYELLGFAAGMKLYGRTPKGALGFLRAWGRGHRAILRDRRELRELCRAKAAPEVPSGPAVAGRATEAA